MPCLHGTGYMFTRRGLHLDEVFPYAYISVIFLAHLTEKSLKWLGDSTIFLQNTRSNAILCRILSMLCVKVTTQKKK